MSLELTPADALDPTASALDGPLTRLTPSAAFGIIDRWRTACRTSQASGALAVADGLDGLRDVLAADRIDGSAVGGILRDLARSCRTVAVEDGPTASRVQRIADLLERGADSLGS